MIIPATAYQRVFTASQIDDEIVVGRAEIDVDDKLVVRAGAVDGVDVENVFERIDTGPQVQRVESLLQVDGDTSADLAEQASLCRQYGLVADEQLRASSASPAGR